MLIGQRQVCSLASRHVVIFGVGGVGGYVAEVLARSGVGALSLIDPDTVSVTNINRQIIATTSTLGQLKVDVMKHRILDINPACQVRTFPIFYLPESAAQVPLQGADFVVDCIDTVTAKIEIIKQCHSLDIPVITCLGAANKLDPTAFRVANLFATHTDPLARVMRKKLRQVGIDSVMCVFSDEQPIKPTPCNSTDPPSDDSHNEPTPTISPLKPKRITPASNAFVPAAEGLVAAAHVVRHLTALP